MLKLQSAKYYLEYAGPMKPKPSDDIIQQKYNLLHRFPTEFKNGYFLIVECMRECGHQDAELFNEYAQVDIFGGWYHDSQTPEERNDCIDREQYTGYMIDSLINSPSARFIPYENKEVWKAENERFIESSYEPGGFMFEQAQQNITNLLS